VKPLRLLRRTGAAGRSLAEIVGILSIVVATWGVDWRAGLAALGAGMVAEANFGEWAR
jgi:hypothetical protein